MAITYLVDQAQRRLHTRVEGRVTVEEILGHLETVKESDVLSYSELIDVGGAARPFLSPAEIWRLATAVGATHLKGPLGPRAVVAADDLLFGLVRIFTNLMTGQFPIQVFRSQEAAAEWLADRLQPANNPVSPHTTAVRPSSC